MSLNNPGKVPLLGNESERLAALQSYHILDTAEEKDFDDLTTLASAICQTPIALVSLVDKDRQWFKSHKGLSATETPKEYSFCAHAIAAPDPIMIIGDATKDKRFANNPLVTGAPHIAFYAGVPLVNKEGFGLGSLCVIDSQVRELSAEQISALMIVARQVVDKLEARRNLLEIENSNINLQESEKQFRNLVSQAPVAIAMYKGPDLIISQANDQILKIWGRDKSIIGRPLLTVRPEMEGHRYLDIVREVLRSGKLHEGHAIQGPVLRNGELVEGYFDTTYKAIFDDDHKITGVMVIAIDVTDKILARQREEKIAGEMAAMNEELSLLAEQLSYVNNSIPQQVWTATPNGLLDFVNEQTTEYFGKPAEDILGDKWAKFVHPEDSEKAGAAWLHALTTGEPYQTEFRLLDQDGAYIWHLARAIAFKEDGKVIKWFGTNTDINGHKQLEQHKSDFISIASHELKTPITSLKATLQLIDRIKDQPSSVIMPKLIEQANRGMVKITNLVDDLLSASRMSDGQLHLNRSAFNVAVLLDESLSHIKLEGGHEIITEGDLNVTLNADEHLIEQVIINFVNNAIKYAAQCKQIIINVKKDDGQIKIAVKDKGPGIEKEKQAHLFDRYYRVDHAGRQYSGLGLGLYICAEIIKKHGGEIGVDSQIGVGSTFWFSLPV